MASGLSLLLLAVLVGTFVFFTRSLLGHGRHSTAQRNVLMVINRIRDEIHSASRESLYCNDPSWFSFASYSLPDNSMTWNIQGQVLWTHWTVIYHDAQATQVRQQDIAIDPPEVDLLPPQMTTFSPSSGDRVIATGISAFNCSVSPSGVSLAARSQVEEAVSEMVTTLNPATTRAGAYGSPTPSPSAFPTPFPNP